MASEGSRNGRPIGKLRSGEPYYAPIGQMRYDGDRVQCHLCGRWLKKVGGSHLIAAHGITTAQYRDMFHLYISTSTVAPETAERKRASMLEQFATGQRERKLHRRSARRRSAGGAHSRSSTPSCCASGTPRATRRRPRHRADSQRKVWWCCRTCGHEWQVSPHERTFAGKGCPLCGRRRSIAATIDRNRSYKPPPERSFAARRPDLLAEWHPTRNDGLDPHTIAAGSERKIWWRCSTPGCGREWQAVVMDRTKGKLGCPACVYQRAGRDALAPIPTDRSRRCTPTCSMSGTQPATATSTRTPSSPDQSEDCGGTAPTAGTSGKHHRCHAGTARAAAAQPARSASHAASNSLGQRHRPSAQGWLTLQHRNLKPRLLGG